MAREFEICEVGPFRVPGVTLKEPPTADELSEMDVWANSDQGTGKRLSDTLWYFRKESERDWWILRWT